jgi:hypothetical protein
MIILGTNIQDYIVIKASVEAKWDIIAMLCLLVFFLAVAAATYAIMRPEGVTRKLVALIIAFALGYTAAYFGVHRGLAPEFYQSACVEFMDRMGVPKQVQQPRCTQKNPINLSRVKRSTRGLKF